MLLEYPHIADYVEENIKQRYYYESGVFKSSFTEQLYAEAPTKSYAKWLEEKVAREKRMASLEIRTLVFGETAGPRAQIEKSGHRPGWKRWAILKASEITK